MLALFFIFCYTIAMMKTYKKLYQKVYGFFTKRPVLKQILFILDKGLTALIGIAYMLLLITAVKKDYNALDFIAILFAPLLCLFIVWVLRLAVPRPRPFSDKGAGIIPLAETKKSEFSSFPSRHVASAFVIAGVFLPHVTAVAVLMYLMGVLLGFIRFALGLHYPTDLLLGAFIGVFCTALTWFI